MWQVYRVPGAGHRVAEAGEPRNAEGAGNAARAERCPCQARLQSVLIKPLVCVGLRPGTISTHSRCRRFWESSKGRRASLSAHL